MVRFLLSLCVSFELEEDGLRYLSYTNEVPLVLGNPLKIKYRHNSNQKLECAHASPFPLCD